MRSLTGLWALAGIALPALLFGQLSATRLGPADSGKALVIELSEQPQMSGPAGSASGRDNTLGLPGVAVKAMASLAGVNTPEIILVSVIIEPGRRAGLANRPSRVKAATALVGAAHPASQPTLGTSVPSAAEDTKHPGDLKIDDIGHVVPSGYMGDAMSEHGGTVNLESGNTKNCYEEPACYRLEYNQGVVGDAGWAAIGWQYVTEGGMNWGDDPGADLHAKGFQSLRIWASGEAAKDGKYPKVQFKSGGNTKPRAAYPGSYAMSGPTAQLGAQPAEFCLDLTGRDLTNVVSPFTVVVTKGANPAGAVVIMSDIHYSTQPCGQ